MVYGTLSVDLYAHKAPLVPTIRPLSHTVAYYWTTCEHWSHLTVKLHFMSTQLLIEHDAITLLPRTVPYVKLTMRVTTIRDKFVIFFISVSAFRYVLTQYFSWYVEKPRYKVKRDRNNNSKSRKKKPNNFRHSHLFG